MVKFSFVVCAEPYKYEATDTLINLSEAIINKGHEILGVFFYGSGVYNIKGERNVGKGNRNLPENLNKIFETLESKLIACSTWINFTGIKKEEFLTTAFQEGLGSLSDLIARSDRVIFFGPGG